MSPHQFPHISDELMQALEAMVPHTSPRLGETHDEMLFRGGQRHLVDVLRAKHADQSRNILDRRIL